MQLFVVCLTPSLHLRDDDCCEQWNFEFPRSAACRGGGVLLHKGGIIAATS